jgi:hypothetical protein
MDTRPRKKEKTKQNTNIEEQNTKWAAFIDVGKETKFIRKLFKKSNIKVAYRTNYINGKLLVMNNPKDNKYDNAGMFKLKYTAFEKYYVVQTGRNYKTR